MRILKALLAVLPAVCAAPNPHEFFKAVSYFGLETEYGVQDGTGGFMCTWENPISFYVQKMSSLGFNSVRVPFSYDFVKKGNWQNLDTFFSEVEKTNLSVILDLHRLHSTHQSYLPYDDEISFEQVLGAWDTILARYAHHDRLVALDIFNEPQSATDYATWNNLARQMISFIDSKYGQYNFLYLVEGIGWGGNIAQVDMEGASWSDRVRYTIHKYQFSQSESGGQSYEQQWEYSFNLATHPAEKIVVGEYGWISDRPDQVLWANRFIAWLRKNNIRNSIFWCLTHTSFDTGGILMDCSGTVDCRKMKMLHTLWD